MGSLTKEIGVDVFIFPFFPDKAGLFLVWMATSRLEPSDYKSLFSFFEWAERGNKDIKEEKCGILGWQS